MEVLTYHFVRTPTEGSELFFKRLSLLNAVVCFDLEDSIKTSSGSLDSELKDKTRTKILNFLRNYNTHLSECRLGIRINKSNSYEFEKDISFLKSFSKFHKIDCIFLPKIEKPEDVILNTASLQNAGIIYNDIIPIIESKKGLENLQQIISAAGDYFTRFAFGHCDFNLDNRIFPFHHQYSNQYWKWIDTILSTINQSNKIFINSPFLFLNDDTTFKWTLSQLSERCRKKFGQVTMTLNQSNICNNFQNQKKPTQPEEQFQPLRLNQTAEEIKKKYEMNVADDRSFAVDLVNKIVISPQEYLAAKTYGKDILLTRGKLNVLIVGGCFTEQHNIEPSGLYHHLLANKLQEYKNVEMKLQIIRYERLTRCLEKINRSIEFQLDIILFHVRPEPLLRITKFFYRYKDKSNNLIKKFNIAFLKRVYAESQQYKINPVVDRNYRYPEESLLHRILIDCNYFLGMAIGNLRYGLKLYLNLVCSINQYCSEKNIDLLVVGPVSRPHTFVENKLAAVLDNAIKYSLLNLNIPYVSCIGERTNENEWLFGTEGIFVNELGHRRVSELIYQSLVENSLIQTIATKELIHEEIAV